MNNWIVDLNQKEQARGTALVFVPHAGGGPNAFRSVAREIRRKLPVYAICYPGHENRISEPLVDDFSFVAEGIAKARPHILKIDLLPISDTAWGPPLP